MTANVADILHQCRLFTEVLPSGFARLVTMARICRFDKGHLVFRERDECPGVYVVGSGLVRVFKTSSSGKEHVLHMVAPGETFAEVAAIGNFPCPASAEAVEPTECALLPVDLFRRALQTDHALCLEMMTGMSMWVRHLVGLMEDIVLRDATGRLARFLLQSNRNEAGLIELPGLKRHLASHLNLTSETFSRTLRRLAEAGLITQPDPGQVKLVDPTRLRQVADGLFPKL